MAVSTTTLCFISLDRFIGICQNSFNRRDVPHPKYAIPVMWLAAFLFFTPTSIYCKKSVKIKDNSCDCYNEWPSHRANRVFKMALVAIWILIPFAIMIFCYVKILRKLRDTGLSEVIPNDPTGSKKKSVMMLVLSTATFFASWFPYACLFILRELKIGDQDVIRYQTTFDR